MYQDYGKRILDLVIALSALVILSPLLLLIALLIKLTSPGPVFFAQQRVGHKGTSFTVLKFRTMVDGAEKMGSGILCEKDDPRVTSVGRLVRMFSLDELPQLLNVVRGEMSVIGPRPGLGYQAAKYSPFQRRRLDVKPGITGWAQVNGRNSISWDERIAYDVEYVENLSFALDMKIIFRTFKTILLRENLIAEKDYFREKVVNSHE